jgi:hypothetical protein
MVFTEFIKYTFQFLIEAVFHNINFILCWGMNIQNNNMKPATSQYYVWYPITSKINPLNCSHILWCWNTILTFLLRIISMGFEATDQLLTTLFCIYQILERNWSTIRVHQLFTERPTNYPTLWSWALLEMPHAVEPLDSFPAFYGTRTFITTCKIWGSNVRKENVYLHNTTCNIRSRYSRKS